MNNLKYILTPISIVFAGFLISNTYKIGKQYERYVRVKGIAKRQVNANLAVWPISIAITGNDLIKIKSKIDSQSKKVYEFFVKQGFTDKELSKGATDIQDFKVDNFGLDRSYRYLAKLEFSVRTKDIKKLKKTFSESLKLSSQGILLNSKNHWKPIEYMFTDLNKIKPSMVEEATKNARKVAEKFALDSKSRVGKIKSAYQGLFTINDIDYNTPDIKIVRVVSTVEYLLE